MTRCTNQQAFDIDVPLHRGHDKHLAVKRSGFPECLLVVNRWHYQNIDNDQNAMGLMQGHNLATAASPQRAAAFRVSLFLPHRDDNCIESPDISFQICKIGDWKARGAEVRCTWRSFRLRQRLQQL